MCKITNAIIIDPRNSGSSGDMFLSVFLDLFDDYEVLNELVHLINQKFDSNMAVEANKIVKGGINSTILKIEIKNDIKSRHAKNLLEYCKTVLNDLDI